MAIEAICGKSAWVKVGGVSYSAHAFTLEKSTTEIDITGFESGDYGDWLACLRHATLTIQMYQVPSVDEGDTVAWTADLPYTSEITLAGNGKVTSKSLTVDAKGVVENGLTIRITGDITVGP